MLERVACRVLALSVLMAVWRLPDAFAAYEPPKKAPGAGKASGPAKSPALPKAAEAVKTDGSARIEFLDLPEMDISNLLKIMSDTTEWNIIPGKDVKGKVFAYLKDIDAETALQKIVESNGYKLVREGNTIIIMTREEYDLRVGAEVEQRVFKLQYARAAQAAPLLASALSTKGRAMADATSNQIVVSDMPNRFEAIEALVSQIDQRQETRVISLQHALAADLWTSLKPFVGDPLQFELDERTNQLIVTDTPYHLDRLEEVVRQLDLEDLTETRSYPLKYANAEDVADILSAMITGQPQTSTLTRQRTGSRGQRGQQPAAVMSSASSVSAFGRRDESRSYLSASVTRNEATQRLGGMEAAAPVVQSAPPSGAAPAAGAAAGGPAGGPAAAAPAMAAPPGTVTSAGVTAAAPSAAEPGAPAAPGEAANAALEEARALGVQGTVVADPRTNTVIVTHTPAVLKHIEEVIQALDAETAFFVFQFQHADFDSLDLNAKLADLLPGPNEDYQVDTGTRKVTFRAPAERAEHILTLFREWDQLAPQVYIEARIMRVALDLIRNLGVSIYTKDTDSQGHLKTLANIVFPPTIGTNSQGYLQFGDLSSDEYTVILQALETDNRSKLLSNPKVTVLDRREALFQVAVDQPFEEVVIDGATQTTRQSTRFIPVGVIMQVRPSISQSGQVQMDIRVEASSLKGLSPNNVPIVDRSEAQSSVVVQDGHTLAGGGLIEEERQETIKRVPILGEIPILKYAFRSKSHEMIESELLIFITPTIVSTGTPAPPPEQLHTHPMQLTWNAEPPTTRIDRAGE